ncbi:MAG: sodium-dependent transporter [Lachnospiraceae bacterium]|nr:sodium-dependent transporter [Lachnospiraceae bacterium]
MKEKRGSFSGKIGFFLAAAGSAVGLGNLWRFPYLAAQHGGGIFIAVYIILVVTFGFSLLLLELAIGRKTKKSSIEAYKILHKKFGFLGYLASAVPIIILPYYCVIGGWVLKYMCTYFTGGGAAAADSSYFGNFISGNVAPIVFFVIFLALTLGVVIGGVQSGIERVSKILMPVLLLITVGISIYICTLPNAWEGIKYYILPDISNLSVGTVCAAMGQLFFSMSIAMGIMVSYGSYVKDDIDLNGCVNYIELFDTAVALLSGFMIVPVVYIFNGGVTTGGPGLMFETLPQVFVSMPFGNIIGALFFVLVLLAALTSSISIMEAIVSIIMDKLRMSRIAAVLITAGSAVVLGLPSALGFGLWSHIKVLGMDILTFFDYLSNSVMMPIVALCTCLLGGWFIKKEVLESEITKNGEKFGRRYIYRVMVKYIAPIFLIMILVYYTLLQFGLIE